MYKTSNDRRFRKNKTAIQRAYIDLVVEKGYQHVTITDIAERADINRMTFYAHYETIEDIFSEFVDDITTDKIKQTIEELLFTKKYNEMKIVAESDKTDIYLYSCIAKKSLECLRRK